MHTRTSEPQVAQRADGGLTGSSTRIESIDILRGAVMVLMALDHVRDYVTKVRFRIPIIGNPQAIPADHGLPLLGVYAVWLLVVVSLYYPYKRFARLKATRNKWWLHYM